MNHSVEEFKKKLTEIRELSTLPHVMMRIMEIVTDENSSAADLAKEIAIDTSLTAKILKMVNSAYYGFYREIVKVSDAVVVLGFNEIRRLSLAISVMDMFGVQKAKDRVKHWNHSFTCAAMSDILAKEWLTTEEGAFTAGLLHDVGKVVFDQYFEEMSVAVQACMRERSLKAHEAERHLYGFDHADVGYWLSERWNLPVSLSEAIQFHHRPESAREASDLARVVHVADLLSLEFVELKASGFSADDIPGDSDDGLPLQEKIGLFFKLEKRVKDLAVTGIFVQ